MFEKKTNHSKSSVLKFRETTILVCLLVTINVVYGQSNQSELSPEKIVIANAATLDSLRVNLTGNELEELLIGRWNFVGPEVCSLPIISVLDVEIEKTEDDVWFKREVEFKHDIVFSEDGQTASLSYEVDEEQKEQTVTLGDEFVNELGSFRIVATEYFDSYVIGESFLSKEYMMVYLTDEQLITGYLNRLIVGEAREKASILRLSLRDESGPRGVDVLNAILNVYIQNNIEKRSSKVFRKKSYRNCKIEFQAKFN